MAIRVLKALARISERTNTPTKDPMYDNKAPSGREFALPDGAISLVRAIMKSLLGTRSVSDRGRLLVRSHPILVKLFWQLIEMRLERL